MITIRIASIQRRLNSSVRYTEGLACTCIHYKLRTQM